MPSNKNETKVVYAEPVSYFPRKVRKEFKLGEFAESEETAIE